MLIMKVYPSFGAAMRRLRVERGLSQEELAEKMDMTSNAHISRLENGKKLPSLEMVFRLADALDIKASKLIAIIEENDNS